jgi:hypothetical protein
LGGHLSLHKWDGEIDRGAEAIRPLSGKLPLFEAAGLAEREPGRADYADELGLFLSLSISHCFKEPSLPPVHMASKETLRIPKHPSTRLAFMPSGDEPRGGEPWVPDGARTWRAGARVDLSPCFPRPHSLFSLLRGSAHDPGHAAPTPPHLN